MNLVSKITLLILYVLFAQLYPVAHLQMHNCEEDNMLVLSSHFPDIPINDLEHDLQHKHAENHGHNDFHCIGDPDYTVQAKSVNFQPFGQTLLGQAALHQSELSINHQIHNCSTRIPTQFLPGSLPDRAPPRIHQPSN